MFWNWKYTRCSHLNEAYCLYSYVYSSLNWYEYEYLVLYSSNTLTTKHKQHQISCGRMKEKVFMVYYTGRNLKNNTESSFSMPRSLVIQFKWQNGNIHIYYYIQNVMINVYIWMPPFTHHKNSQFSESLSTDKTLPTYGMWCHII